MAKMVGCDKWLVDCCVRILLREEGLLALSIPLKMCSVICVFTYLCFQDAPGVSNTQITNLCICDL